MKFEFSAGGVVYKQSLRSSPTAVGLKKDNEGLKILVSQHSQHHGWVFPKGKIDKGETKEEAALREVKEESGAEAEILQAMSPISYWYAWEEEKRKKTVYYFIMKYTGGDITQHDYEMEAVEWIAPEEVLTRLTYKGDKDVFKEALPIIQSLV